ncbi:MAG: hypothetical protein HY343_00695 [Lentisphaerae bacterium]|nr:hypothetical protein [Lentisphaerota bacterium]
MAEEYPKQPHEIMIKVTRNEMEDGIRTKKEVSVCKLSDKLQLYLTRFGHSNAHIYNVIIHLLTEAKVRVDFKDYIERIELVEESDKLERAAAITLLEDYIDVFRGDDKGGFTTTQRIVIQPPK